MRGGKRLLVCMCAVVFGLCAAHGALCADADCRICAIIDGMLELCALALFCRFVPAQAGTPRRLSIRYSRACALFIPSVYKFTCLLC